MARKYDRLYRYKQTNRSTVTRDSDNPIISPLPCKDISEAFAQAGFEQDIEVIHYYFNKDTYIKARRQFYKQKNRTLACVGTRLNTK